jgi:Lipase (class 3)
VSDLSFARRAAECYAKVPSPLVYQKGDMLTTLRDGVLAIRGTVNWRNWCRDFDVRQVTDAHHPELGRVDAGALDAAILLDALIPRDAPISAVTGHSLGGQIALILSALRDIPLTVTWDAPKAGGDDLAAQFQGRVVRQYRFRDSIVTDWPPLLGHHVVPLVDIGYWHLDPIDAHSIDAAVDWMDREEKWGHVVRWK